MRSPLDCAPENTRGGYLWSCNFMISAALFERIGKFDDRFHIPQWKMSTYESA